MVSSDLRLKYPDKVPVVIKRANKSKNIKDIGNIKYLIQDYITVGQFIYILRKRIELNPDEALYLYAIDSNSKNEYALNGNTEMIAIYNEYKNKKDSILYLKYAGENVFG
tara:strand:+ start:211 stop:540 length:330 start_codon:yes stop_codon:yes gene_type:complete